MKYFVFFSILLLMLTRPHKPHIYIKSGCWLLWDYCLQILLFAHNTLGSVVMYEIWPQLFIRIINSNLYIQNTPLNCAIVLKICKEHGSITAMLCAKFQNKWITDKQITGIEIVEYLSLRSVSGRFFYIGNDCLSTDEQRHQLTVWQKKCNHSQQWHFSGWCNSMQP